MTGKYEGGGPGSALTSRNTGRGVHGRGEPKGLNPGGVGKPTARSGETREGRGLKGPVVTAVRPETGRSSPGQGEAGRKPRGGPKGF